MPDHMAGKTAKNDSSFFEAALIRAVRTMAQTAVAMLPAAATIAEVDWFIVVQTAAFAGIVSLLTSVATDLPEAPRVGNET